MEKSYQEIEAPMNGVKIYLNKVVSDDRGHFLDLAETDNPIIGTIKHVHSAIALHKGVSRGEHYHYKVIEDFYTLSGTSLGILHDFDENSSTFGKTYAYISGDKPKEEIQSELPTFYNEDNRFAQFQVMPKIWHAWWPITDEKVVILAFGTHGYDPDDYAKPTAQEVPGVKEILKQFDIK